MKYRIVIVEKDADDFGSFIYGKYKYHTPAAVEEDARALKQSLEICGIQALVKAEGTT
jgi:hypothetical protein